MSYQIYGEYSAYLPLILKSFQEKIEEKNKQQKLQTGFKLYEHFLARVKSQESMMDKCQRKSLPLHPHSALREIKDSIGIRIICGFVEDIFFLVDFIKKIEGVSVYNEKDFVSKPKPNGYRSYHLILEVETPFPDCLGHQQGKYFIEVQLRTIAMDSWASLEHQMKYKHDIKNPERLVKELKRCADELASCDLSMQTIRQLIQEGGD
ncbi:GTP pyrophosphokinase [Streptococcus porcorum]|uniref:PpGpp synthetase/RelA/SpoT-type nucleotidyltransferase n=1 Tax=Streptococcus porcorum TaxID=701526 RepID=A0ABV2JG07_9STRE